MNVVNYKQSWPSRIRHVMLFVFKHIFSNNGPQKRCLISHGLDEWSLHVWASPGKAFVNGQFIWSISFAVLFDLHADLLFFGLSLSLAALTHSGYLGYTTYGLNNNHFRANWDMYTTYTTRLLIELQYNHLFVCLFSLYMI